MIATQDKLDVYKSKELVARNFTIKSSAKAFEILSGKLYSDNISSIVRELSCNSYDSHLQAGKQQIPFLIHLPNTLEPYFSIKDYGTGLSHEDVLNVYCTYFESTKCSTNDFIGCWGLGSKTPFSYTDTFTVISIFEGVKKTYCMFLDENNTPSITEISSLETSECNGLEVKLLVEQTDFSKFETSVKCILQWFNPLPEIIGKQSFSFDKQFFILKNNLYGILDNNNSPVILMGNISYKLNIFIPLEGLVIFSNIGDVDVTANRENLNYSDKTKSFIDKSIKSVNETIKTDFENKLLNPGMSEWEKVKLVSSFNNQSIKRILKYPSLSIDSSLSKFVKLYSYGKKWKTLNINDVYYKDKYSFFLNDKNYSDRKFKSILIHNNRKHVYCFGNDPSVLQFLDKTGLVRSTHNISSLEAPKYTRASKYNPANRSVTFTSILGTKTQVLCKDICSDIKYIVVKNKETQLFGKYLNKNQIAIIRDIIKCDVQTISSRDEKVLQKIGCCSLENEFLKYANSIKTSIKDFYTIKCKSYFNCFQLLGYFHRSDFVKNSVFGKYLENNKQYTNSNLSQSFYDIILYLNIFKSEIECVEEHEIEKKYPILKYKNISIEHIKGYINLVDSQT